MQLPHKNQPIFNWNVTIVKSNMHHIFQALVLFWVNSKKQTSKQSNCLPLNSFSKHCIRFPFGWCLLFYTWIFITRPSVSNNCFYSLTRRPAMDCICAYRKIFRPRSCNVFKPFYFKYFSFPFGIVPIHKCNGLCFFYLTLLDFRLFSSSSFSSSYCYYYYYFVGQANSIHRTDSPIIICTF